MKDNNHIEQEYKEIKTDRVMELFFRAIKGESLSPQSLADEYHVSTRSITRDINHLKSFLAEHRETIGYAELEYSSTNHCYTLKLESFLSNKELIAVSKILVGSRALNHQELVCILKKLKQNTTYSDRSKLDQLLRKELYHYNEVGADCLSVIDQIWKLTDCIEQHRVATLTYFKVDRSQVKRKILPVSILFSEYYFYLIAYRYEKECSDIPIYFRIDRITDITVHRETFTLTKEQDVDEGLLRQKSQFMWPGPERRIRFEFTGPSVQAVLDRIPTARIVDQIGNKSILEAEVFGTGIKMFLLSQGAWVKVLGPEEFVVEMREEVRKMLGQYE